MTTSILLFQVSYKCLSWMISSRFSVCNLLKAHVFAFRRQRSYWFEAALEFALYSLQHHNSRRLLVKSKPTFESDWFNLPQQSSLIRRGRSRESLTSHDISEQKIVTSHSNWPVAPDIFIVIVNCDCMRMLAKSCAQNFWNMSTNRWIKIIQK